ncbi:hypothetical protein D3C71_2046790 [compost metagenome]
MWAEKDIRSTFSFSRSISTLPVDWAASTWKRMPRARVSSPMAAMSLMVPISLFTCMIETRMVSSRSAASTIAGVMMPSSPGSR